MPATSTSLLTLASMLIAAVFAHAVAWAGTPRPAPTDWITAAGADHPLVGRVWSVEAQEFVGPEGVSIGIADARFVMLGEKHDNPDHHRLQAWIVEALARSGRRPAVVFEMIGADRADSLAQALVEADGDADALGVLLDWDAHGWPDWEIYRPIFAAALTAGLPVAAGDAARATIRTVSRGGLDALDADRRRALALDTPLPDAFAEELRQVIADVHCDMLPDRALDGMAEVQRFRDAALAASLAEAARLPGVDGAVLIAGAGHLRRDWGTPYYLNLQGEKGGTAIVVFREVEPGRTEPSDYLDASAAESIFDYLWFTPRLDDEDPCEKFAEQLERMRQRAPEAHSPE